MAGGNLKNKMRFWKPKPVKQAMADVFAGYNSKEAARTSAAKQMWAIKRMEYDMMTEAQREALAAQRQDNADAFASALAGVCQELCVDPPDISGPSRMPRVLAARLLLVGIMRGHTAVSLPELREMMKGDGNRSHSVTHSQMVTLSKSLDTMMHPNTSETFGECLARWDHKERKFRKAGA